MKERYITHIVNYINDNYRCEGGRTFETKKNLIPNQYNNTISYTITADRLSRTLVDDMGHSLLEVNAAIHRVMVFNGQSRPLDVWRVIYTITPNDHGITNRLITSDPCGDITTTDIRWDQNLRVHP